MKKILFATILLLQFLSTHAQDNRLSFGLKMGANYSNVYDSKGANFTADPKLGFATGLFFSIPIVSIFSVQPEVLFSQKGFKAKGTVLGSSYTFTRTTSYIDVPILLSITPVQAITLLAGPQYSYLLKEKNVYTGALTVEQQNEFNNSNIRKNILGITGGLDINIKNMVISGRAGWDILNNNGDGSSSTPRYKNAWFQATLGFKI